MDVFADKSTLACTALALMDNYANKPPTFATLGCVLIGVYHMRPSRTFSPTDPHWRVLRRPYGHFRRQVHHPRYIASCVYWRVLQAAFTDILANGSILVGTAVALMDSFADKPTIRATWVAS
jgi:hypothetical protein